MSTLNKFLSEHGISNDICRKLADQDIGWDELLWLETEDLETLCGKDQLKLPFKQKLKFKTAVKTLQSLYKLKEKSLSNIVLVTMNEQNSLDKIKNELKNSQNVQTLLENHFIEIDDHSQKLNEKVDKEFDYIINKIKQRKQSLYKKIEEWKLNKLESVNKNISNITQYQQELAVTKKQCKEMLKIDHNDSNREHKIKEITEKLFEKYNIQLKKFIENNIQLMNIEFLSEKNKINQLNKYGRIVINGSRSICSIPEIKLIEVVKTNESDNGYKIKLKWKIFGKQNKSHFVIKYIECSMKTNGKFNDEKKDCDINRFDEWNVMNCKQIKCFDENKYEIDAETVLKYNKMYMYKVLLLIEYPINISIESNILKLRVKYEKAIEGSVIQIPLIFHSHRKHDKDNDPSNMLISNDHKRYYSAANNDFHSGDTEDWIVFKINDDNLYFPTKFVIKNWEYDNGIQKMIIQIGDGYNKFFTFNSNKVFHIKKGSSYHNKYQEFSITGIGSSLIKNNKYKHIKIKFI
eukprot:209390_1